MLPALQKPHYETGLFALNTNKERLRAPKIISSGPIKVPLKRYTYFVERVCSQCNKVFQAKKRGKATPRFCGKHCSATFNNARPDIKSKISLGLQKLITRKCKWCRKAFTFHSGGVTANRRRFCGTSCSAMWRMRQPERKAQIQTW